MKAINAVTNKNELWGEVEKALKEHTTSGYKIACIEAQKVFLHQLRIKGYPTKNLKNLLAVFGWKLTDKKSLQDAIEKTELIKNSFEYTLSSFEAEDIVTAYAKAIKDFSRAKTLSWQRRLGIIWDSYLSIRSSFAKRFFLGFILALILIKFLSSTDLGRSVANFAVSVADFFFSWFIMVLVGAGILVFLAFGITAFLEKNKSKIKEIG